MWEQNRLTELTDNLIALMRGDTYDRDTAERVAKAIHDAAKQAPAARLNDALSRLAPLMPAIPMRRAALLAVLCGALMEFGGRVDLIAEPVYARFSEAVQSALPFVIACLDAAAASASTSGETLGADEAIKRYGQQVSALMPAAAQALASVERLNTAALAVCSRSKPLRKRLQADVLLIQAIQRLERLGVELSCMDEMLSILDDERIVVLHPDLGRGYVVRVAGIGKNFDLYVLLADALVGDVEQGWLPGVRPAPEVIALAKDAPMGDLSALPSTVGAFNLWNWTRLLADGSLPHGLSSGEHWIWIEGLPADIVRFQGVRVILVGTSPYQRSWNGGRFFPGMTGELEILQWLSAEEAREWLTRIAQARKPVLANERKVTHADIERLES